MKTTTLTLVLFLAGCGDAALPTDEDLETQSAGAKASSAPPKPQLPGSGSSGGGGGTSAPVCGGSGTATTDQAQLSAVSLGRLAPGESVAQTINVGKTGVLTGVEVSVSYCNLLDRKAQLRLDVLDANGIPLAEAHISAANLPRSCSAVPLSASKTGAAFFDLSSACLKVTKGQAISIAIAADGLTAGTCDFDRGCLTGVRKGQICNEDAECASADLHAGLGFDSYLTGFASMNGTGYAVYDMAFKTTVR